MIIAIANQHTTVNSETQQYDMKPNIKHQHVCHYNYF